MNKRTFLIFTLLALALFFFKEKAEHKKTVVHKISDEQIKEIDEKEEKQILKRKALSKETSSIIEDDEDPNWQENVKTNILRQTSDPHVDIQLTKEKSFVWEELGTPIEVSSVKVSLRNIAGETSTFRALIDQNTGKVLRTWDRPVFDPINPREVPGIKLSPLYHPQD